MKPAYSTVEKINHAVNEDVRYASDVDLYQIDEFWEIADAAGDCEDYALKKRQLLLEHGVDPQYLRLATCWTESGEYHAVLIVSTDKGDYVLDNRYQFPMMRQDLPYKWHKIQVGKSWHVIS